MTKVTVLAIYFEQTLDQSIIEKYKTAILNHNTNAAASAASTAAGEHSHVLDSGFDLFIPNDITLEPISTYGRGTIVNLMVRCSLMINGVSAPYMLACRSSISKTPLRMSNGFGVMDAEYRGPVSIPLDNLSSQSYQVPAGNRYCQIVTGDMQPINEIVIVDNIEDLGITARGANGFGSTGQ